MLSTLESIEAFEIMRQWRFIYDMPPLSSTEHSDGILSIKGYNGAYNMAVDDAILDSVARGDQPPTLRLYAWSPPCLSLGYAQDESDADLERIARFGWGIVRRPTGGRAILHTDELTYSLAMPADHPIAEGDIVASYRRISQALMTALEALGLHPESRRREIGEAKQVGAVCFETPSHYEITVGGRKLIGSAQVRRKNGVLQHGSLPLTGDLGRICDALAYPDETARTAAKPNVYARAITLSEALNREVSWHNAAQAVVYGFQTTFNITLQPSTLSQTEHQHTEQLVTERYRLIERVKTRV